MYYTYVLLSKKDGKLYIGHTNDLKDRLALHKCGRVQSTSNRRPFILLYYEACLSKQDAVKREKYFKTGFGRRFLKNRLENFFNAQARDGGRGKDRQKMEIKVYKKSKRIVIEDWKK